MEADDELVNNMMKEADTNSDGKVVYKSSWNSTSNEIKSYSLGFKRCQKCRKFFASFVLGLFLAASQTLTISEEPDYAE